VADDLAELLKAGFGLDAGEVKEPSIARPVGRDDRITNSSATMLAA
jgi:hypothetical protein